MIKLGKWFNTDVNVHWSIIILMALTSDSVFNFFVNDTNNHDAIPSIICSIIFSLGLLFSIVCHEFGHILVGRKHGIKFGNITLHLLGGVASITGEISNPKSEFWMAISGPLVSMALAVILGVIALFSEITGILPRIVFNTIGLLCATNILLGAWNLLPAYPSDGGRVLRSLIWKLSNNFLMATKIAVFIGCSFGVLLIGSGITMMFGAKIPVLGSGSISGLWSIMLGSLIILISTKELSYYKNKLI